MSKITATEAMRVFLYGVGAFVSGVVGVLAIIIAFVILAWVVCQFPLTCLMLAVLTSIFYLGINVAAVRTPI